MNVWIDILSGRFGDYVVNVIEQHEYFDFMTLLRRVLADKTLMDEEIILGTYKLAREEEHNQAPSDEAQALNDRVKEVLIPVDQAFEKLDQTITIEHMRHSTMDVADGVNRGYSVMIFFWLLVANNAFGAIFEPAGSLIKILDDVFIDKNYEKDDNKQAYVRLTDADETDLLALSLMKIDARLTTIHQALKEGIQPVDDYGNYRGMVQ